MTRSSEEIERDVEATREDLDRTVDALKEKMRPQNLASEAMTSIRNSPTGRRAIRLGHQAQDNAVPLALMGAGLAWLMMNNRRSTPRYETRSFESATGYETVPEGGSLAEPYGAESYGAEPYGAEPGGRSGRAREKTHEMAERTRERVDEVRHRARDGLDRTRQRLSTAASDAAGRARELADDTRERAARYGHKAEETFTETLDREPLIIGALGLAVGAAVGAAMPSTRVENRYVGPLRDRAMDEGRTRARQVASAAVDGAKEEARAQGFTDVDSLVGKAKQIARAGAESAKQEVETRREH